MLDHPLANDPALGSVEPNVAWDLEETAPDLFRQAEGHVPHLGRLLGAVRRGIPYPRAARAPLPGAFVRPHQHFRAFYLDLSSREASTSGCLAFKGTEALAEDFGALVEAMKQIVSVYRWSIAHPWTHIPQDTVMASLLERYALWERKVPGVVLLREAMDEAWRGAQVQLGYLERYGELARLPLPLLVHRFEPEVAERVLAGLSPHLTLEARREISRARDGLGIIVYWYGRVPERARHVDAPSVGPSVSVWDRLERLQRSGDPRAATSRWIALVARLLCLGYVATDPSSAGRGYCVQGQNLIIDGGLADVDSLRLMESFERFAELRAAVEQTIIALADGIAHFLLGAEIHGQPPHGPSYLRSVWSEVVVRCREEAAEGKSLPLPVQKLIEERPAFEVLVERFAEFQELSV